MRMEDIEISDKSVLDFHLSRLTSADFSYVPSKNTSKLIWKYLSSNNLLERVNDIDLENNEKIKTIEKATHDEIIPKKNYLIYTKDLILHLMN